MTAKHDSSAPTPSVSTRSSGRIAIDSLAGPPAGAGTSESARSKDKDERGKGKAAEGKKADGEDGPNGHTNGDEVTEDGEKGGEEVKPAQTNGKNDTPNGSKAPEDHGLGLGLSPVRTTRSSLRRRSGVQVTPGSERKGGEGEGEDARDGKHPTSSSTPSATTEQTLKTPDPSALDPSIAIASAHGHPGAGLGLGAYGSLSVPPNFAFNGAPGSAGSAGGGSGRTTRRRAGEEAGRVLSFGAGEKAAGKKWEGTGLGAAFSENKADETVDFVEWLRSHYKHTPPPYTIATRSTTRSALYTDLAESLPASISPPSKDAVSKLVVEAFPEARWETSPTDGRTQFVRGLVAREGHEPAVAATSAGALGASLGPPSSRGHRYTQSCGLADLAEIAERTRADGHQLRSMRPPASPNTKASSSGTNNGAATPRRTALDELAAAAALSERSPMSKKGRQIEPEDELDPSLGNDGIHPAKKRRTSSARSTVVSPGPSNAGSQSWEAPGWRQQPQSFDRSMGIPEDGQPDTSGEQEADNEDADMDSGRSRRDDAHGGIRIVDPSLEPVNLPPLIPSSRGGRGGAGSSNHSPGPYPSNGSQHGNGSIGMGLGHSRSASNISATGSMTSALYQRNGVYTNPMATQEGYGMMDPPPTPPTQSTTSSRKGKGRARKSMPATPAGANASGASANGTPGRGGAYPSYSPPGYNAPPADDGVQHQKPNFTYHELITHEIKRSPNGRLQLSEIYKRISERYPYFKLGDPGWQNSIRHNLSLKKCFVRVDRPAEGILDKSGKGGWWTYSPEAVDGGRPGRKGAHGRGTGEYRKGTTPSDIAEKEAAAGGRTGEDDYQAWARSLVANEVEATHHANTQAFQNMHHQTSGAAPGSYGMLPINAQSQLHLQMGQYVQEQLQHGMMYTGEPPQPLQAQHDSLEDVLRASRG